MGRTSYDHNGRAVEFQCSRCRKWFGSMMGDYCNECRSKMNYEYSIEQELKELRKEVAKLNNEEKKWLNTRK